MKYSTRNRLITKKLYQQRRFIYIDCGKLFKCVTLVPQMVGRKLGEYGVTKRLGATIHNSKRNEKRRNKGKHK